MHIANLVNVRGRRNDYEIFQTKKFANKRPKENGEKEMTKLTAETRNKLPKKIFGIPGSRKYPMEDKAHARNAKARASEMEHKGRLSKATEERIDKKADRILHKTRGKK